MVDANRRKVLKGLGIAGVTGGLAGCLGDDDSSDDAGGTAGGTGSTDDGTGSTDASGGESSDNWPEFTVDNPQFPQIWSTLVDHQYELGLEQDLDQMEAQEEAHYGQSPAPTPDDESEWLEPDPIEFAYFPAENPATYADSLDPLLENIEDETGHEVNYASINSYAAQIEAMRSERLHLAAFASGPTPYGVNLANFVPVAIQAADGTFGYRLWVVTQADNDEINELSDIAGKNVVHTEETSNSGNLAPNALFAQEGVVPGEDYDIEFSGSHENSGLGVYMGDYDAAPVCSTCVQRVIDDGRIDANDLKVVWSSDPFPEGSFGYINNLHPDLQEGFRNALFEYDYSGTSIPEDFNGRDVFLEIDYNTVWHQNLVIQEANDIEYETGDLD